MAADHDSKPGGAKSLRTAIDVVFGRWPAWPWSVFGLITAGGIIGLFISSALDGTAEESSPALGRAACAGYGLVTAAAISLIPRIVKLAQLWPGVVRRPGPITATWWPLRLLGPALVDTPRLRRTPQEFQTAVLSASARARSILADRLWPAWVVAFVAPVLGLVTAWQNGAKVQLRLQQGEDAATVFPAFIAQVSPPMVATIAAALALMVTIVLIDQCSKGLLRRWSGVVEPIDAGQQCVIDALGEEDFGTGGGSESGTDRGEPAPPPQVQSDPQSGRRRDDELDPDELDELWRRSGSRDG